MSRSNWIAVAAVAATILASLIPFFFDRKSEKEISPQTSIARDSIVSRDGNVTIYNYAEYQKKNNNNTVVKFDSSGFRDCDIEFNIRSIKLNKEYEFYLDFYHGKSKKMYFSEFKIEYMYAENLKISDDDKAIINFFGWSDEIEEKALAMETGENVEVLNMNGKKLKINGRKSNKSFDFAIKYILIFDYTNTPDKSSDDFTHVNCQYYKIID